MIEDTRRANIFISLALPLQNDCARVRIRTDSSSISLFYLGRMRPGYRNRVPAKGSCGGDAADEVLLLGDGFGADGKGVKEIESNEINFDPRRERGGAQRFDTVAGAAVSANDTFLLGFGENVHDAFVALGPVAFGKAVHKANVNLIGAELATEAVEIGAGGGGVAGPSFGKDRDFIARDVLEGLGNVRVAAVGIGRVEETKAVIVTVEEQVGEAFDAERGLVRMVADADGSGPHGEAAGLDAGLAERNGVGGIELSREAG